MKSNRGVEGGWRGQARRAGRQGAPLLMAAMALTMASLACNRGGSSSGEGTPNGVEPGANDTSGVVRYSGMETAESGNSSVRTAVQARRAADWSSPTVATLYPGTVVTRVARYGNYSLVSWPASGGTQQGWVDANVAFTTRWLDAGTTDPGTAVPAFGTPVGVNPGTQPTVVAPQPTVATPTPTVATPTPTPTVTVPPPTKPTVTAPPPTSTVKGGFKPPKLPGH
jgi:hypothetical protein